MHAPRLLGVVLQWLRVVLPAAWIVLQTHAGPVSVSVHPTRPSVRAETTRQFSARQHGACAPVTWSVNAIVGGSPAVGTITDTGLYTAPSIPPLVPVFVRASISAPMASGETEILWQHPKPILNSLQPASFNVGRATIEILGIGFAPNAQVQINGTSIPAQRVSPDRIVVDWNATTSGSFTVRVANPDPGAIVSSGKSLRVLPPVSVKVSPTTRTMRLGTPKSFSAYLANTTNKAVTWLVNGVPGGNATVGTIDTTGLFTAPWAMPGSNTVQVTAVSVADPRATSSATVTFVNPVPELLATDPGVLLIGPGTWILRGRGFVPGTTVKLGDEPVLASFLSPTELGITSTNPALPGGRITLKARNPDPWPASSETLVVRVEPSLPILTHRAAARFLEQATFGADPVGIARLRQIGFAAWLDEQFALPRSSYKASTSSSDSLTRQQAEFFVNAMRGSDQLRQRTAWALSQVFVISGVKTGQPRQMVPYQNLLLEDAFGSYSKLLRDVTLNPAMGVFLDMVNNDKADAITGAVPNENYAREVAQLFTIGTVWLNPDGTAQRTPEGASIPTYTQAEILETARALTGWTFPGKAITRGHNRENYSGPMIPVEANHDTGQKRILGGVILPAGLTATQDLDAVLATLATHPNVAPFISLRLIQQFVVSNPSTDYVARISTVFRNTDGNLGAVVRAILLDPEARAGDADNAPLNTFGGHLRQPVLYLTGMMRSLGATVVDNNPVESLAAEMGQKPFYAPSVFNYYSPFYRLPSGPLAPEFQLMNSATALVRANAVQSLITRNLDGNVRLRLTALQALANFPDELVDAVDHALLYGRMPAEMKAVITAAVQATEGNTERVRTALYLVATSGKYQIEH